ncbi:30S ribosomal protein S19 [Candidatus Hodgkinia cicadicola]|nr:30S ribosomal protein S19 [Candidatus Hodgkinia cicadicola]
MCPTGRAVVTARPRRRETCIVHELMDETLEAHNGAQFARLRITDDSYQARRGSRLLESLAFINIVTSSVNLQSFVDRV